MNRFHRIKEYILPLVKAERSIIVVYAFGSCVRGDSRSDSDIDVAFLMDQSTYKEDPVKAISRPYRVAAKLGLKLNREVDVVVLNSCSIEMAYEIITTGSCLYERDPEARTDYESKIRGLYFDFRPFLERLRAQPLENI